MAKPVNLPGVTDTVLADCGATEKFSWKIRTTHRPRSHAYFVLIKDHLDKPAARVIMVKGRKAAQQRHNSLVGHFNFSKRESLKEAIKDLPASLWNGVEYAE